MIEVEVGDTSSFLALARRHMEGFGRTVYWYRGHASADWFLVPSVHRSYDGVGEHSLMARFSLSAPTRHARCPELGDLASWICLMQHFGLPTRLLDWTASPLAALYFAVTHEPRPGPAAVWALVPSELNRASSCGQAATLVLTGPEAKPLLIAAFETGQLVDEVLAVVGQDVDLRMTVQLGAFTIHGMDRPLEQRNGADRYLVKFLIPQAAKEHFAEELWSLGIRRSSLFPDLGNLAKDLATDFRMIPQKDSGLTGTNAFQRKAQISELLDQRCSDDRHLIPLRSLMRQHFPERRQSISGGKSGAILALQAQRRYNVIAELFSLILEEIQNLRCKTNASPTCLKCRRARFRTWFLLRGSLQIDLRRIIRA